MFKVFQENPNAVYWFFGVIVSSAIAFFAIQKLTKFLINKAIEKGNDHATIIKLIGRILKVFIVLFVLLFLMYFFFDKTYYKTITDNIKLTTYLAIVAVFTLISATLAQVYFNKSIKKKNNTDGDTTAYKFLKYVTTFSIYLIGIALAALAFPSLRGVAQTAIGGAGILAVIAGVASQEALANLVGGVFIIMFKPFKVTDIIKISEEMVGEVTDITLRHTVIRNYENKMIVIPNSIINKEKVINYNLGDRKCCQWIEIGISYDSDIDLAKHIIREECESHPNLIDNRSELDKYNNVKKVIVRVIRLDDSAVTLRAWAWALNFPMAFEMKCDVYESVKKRFDKEGVEIPFPHRTLVLKNNNQKINQ